MSAYHISVLLEKSIDGLAIHPGGTYVDATFGGGGHSREILKRLENGRLFCFDQDPDVFSNIPDDNRLFFFRQDFSYLKNNLRMKGIVKVNGIIADLGVSSHQFNTKERGFSFRLGGPLDMRMNSDATVTAAELIRISTREELTRIFFENGEVRNAGKVAASIVAYREKKPIVQIQDLLEAVNSCLPDKGQNKYLARLFQALRIEANRELDKLKLLLEQSAILLEKGGRLVVITYHSLEDRLVKNFIKYGNFTSFAEKDIYGVIKKPYKPVNRRVIVPDSSEIQANPRARSAKLRIAEHC